MSEDPPKLPQPPQAHPTLRQEGPSRPMVPFVPTLTRPPQHSTNLQAFPTVRNDTISSSGLSSSDPAQHAEFSNIPSQLAGRYDLLQSLGEGGMGRVYKAHDRVLDEPVALKVLRPDLSLSSDAVQRFHQEVKLARRVTHPNVARTFDLGRHEELIFLTMEYVPGLSLRTHLQRFAPLPISQVVSALNSVCGGLTTAHAQGIIHRDLKPENFIVTRNGQLVILDFGIASSKDQRSRGDLAGTLAYMAPEQLEGRRLGMWTDIYALGCIAFEMLTGTMAWDVGNNLQSAMRKTSEDPPDPLVYRPDLPLSIARVIQHAMARESAQRIPNAQAFREALRHAFGDQTLSDLRLGRTHTPIPASSAPNHTPPPSSKTIAVLPFLGPRDEDTIALAEGVTEDLIDALSTLPDVRIRPWGAVAQFSDSKRDLAAIGRSLSVSTLIDASLRRQGDRIRIRTRLINVEDGFQTHAHRFDCAVHEALDISQSIADTLSESLGAYHSKEALDAPPIQVQPDSTLLFLRARHALRTHWYGNLEDLRSATDLFDQALSLSPHDPRILAGTAKAYARLSFGSGEENLSYAFDLVHRALDLDPERGESWFILGLCWFNSDEHNQAIEALHRALSLSPNNDAIHELMGRTLLEVDGPESAIRYLERAEKLNPYNLNLRWDLIRAWAFMLRWDRVHELLALPVNNPNTAIVHSFSAARFTLWQTYVNPSDPVEIPTRTVFGVREETLGYLIDQYTHVAIHKSLEPDFVERFDAFQHAGQGSTRIFHVTLQFAVELSAAAGRLDLARTFLQRAVQAGLSDRVWITRCPMLVALQNEPCIQNYVSKSFH